eukprot:TRINITY_DN3079_c0_g1_i1.p1 TRINITY_DN3079_c0_g1~~TRINITY_DN3079_c0_g1_i1.p1  ORF type:complete len:166 (+),score=23.54 TRINITY_DN3079_c0_g1_i1:120-617(+)
MSFVSSHFPSGLLREEADAAVKQMEIDQKSKSNNALNNVSRELLWEVVSKHNSFLRSNLNKVRFSSEKGNLYNKHSLSASGLANYKTVDIQDGGDCVEITLDSQKPGAKVQPSKMKNKYIIKKSARRGLAGLKKRISHYRPDLADSAVRRMSAIIRAQRKIKAME